MPVVTPAGGPAVERGRLVFRVHARRPTAIDVVLWDADDPARTPLARMPLRRTGDSLWSAELPLDPRQTAYSYLVSTPDFAAPRPALDPWAPAVGGEPEYAGGAGLFGRLPPAPQPNPPSRPPRPATPWARTVLYEVHVGQATGAQPAVAAALRGTYLGLCSPALLEHYHALGVTTLELLPVQHFLSEPRLLRLGMTNAWGYNPVALLAPHEGYASAPGRQVHEFREMVDRLHAAGIEVVIDLVLNHTAEGPEDGPALSLRVLDDAGYYRRDPERPERYLDLTGCGNTLDSSSPVTRRLLLDALRHWGGLGVDGFRLDLAPILARDERGRWAFAGSVLAEALEDPDLAGLKWIVEPWDLGPDGYALGRFPPPIHSWNDRFRDDLRRYWKGDDVAPETIAARLAGSPDLISDGGPKAARRSVDYVTSHDGFTLRDVVSYERKHNEANGEANRDGHTPNHSANWGVEGPTNDSAIRTVRGRVRRALVASLLLTDGVPMLLAGDELGRSLAGNNNAYCQDGPWTWLDWTVPEDERLTAWVAACTRLRAGRPLGGGLSWQLATSEHDLVVLRRGPWIALLHRGAAAREIPEPWKAPPRRVLLASSRQRHPGELPARSVVVLAEDV